jgi:hypothetical protein
MQRLTLTFACALCALALFSCGANTTGFGGNHSASDSLTAVLTPEYSIDADNVQLAVTGAPDAAVLAATGLAGTKAIFGRVYYDPHSQHFQASTQLASEEVLTLFYDDPRAGYVEFAAVLANYDKKPGLDGTLQIAHLTFAAGAADLTRAVSITTDLPEDAVTLQGSIDAANVPTLTWKEGLTGDCNNNGEVEIGDFQPFGIWFRTLPDPVDPADSEARDCDFNGNGEVEIGDITNMGKNFRAILEGYWIQTAPTAAGPFVDFEQFPRATMFPAPARQDGEEIWVWTGAALTADTHFRVQPYHGTDRGIVSENTVLLQPILTITYTNPQISFVGAPTWPANRTAANGDYLVIATELSVDGTVGNAEPFATESLQLVVTAEDVNNPGVPIDITDQAYMGLSEGAGLAAVSLVSASRGELTFRDRGRITVQTFLPGDFTQNDSISFQIMTIDSLTMTSTAGTSPVSVASGTDVPFTVTGKFDADTTTTGNEVNVPLTAFVNWGTLPAGSNVGTFALQTDAGTLNTDNAQAGDTAQVVAEYPNTDDITLYDNRKRTTAPFVVNIT